MTIHLGDNLDVLPTLEAESIDAIVTDPPYDLTSGKRGGSGLASINLDSPYGRARIGTGNGSGGFMGKAWDGTGIAFRPETWAEALRVAKPGAYLLAFGGTRTVHRMTCAIEDAGWEIRDTLVWAYASGFPKSANPGRLHDVATCRAAGTHRDDREHICLMVAPVEWYGLGTALKPAWEPIVMARKPLRGTVARNVTEYGTGALNIDGCRIGATGGVTRHTVSAGPDRDRWEGNRATGEETDNGGRWPANVILTDPIFDGGWDGVVGGGWQDSGPSHILRDSGSRPSGYAMGSRTAETYPDAEGTYSRFFLIPKAARSDREPVLGGLPLRAFGQSGGAQAAMARGEEYQTDGASTGLNVVKHRANVHPTVKPTELMRHLVRLVTPPGGIVLDPFLGSGTTALACEAEGFEWVGIEREAEYVAIAEARLNGTQKGLGLGRVTFTYRRADTLVPVLQAPDHAYVIEEGERVWGVVAGSGSNWYAGPVSPSRTLRPPWTVRGESRGAAAELMTRGRP